MTPLLPSHRLRILLCATVCGCMALPAMAQRVKSNYCIYGSVYDAVTRRDLVGTKVYLLQADGTPCDSMVTRSNSQIANRPSPWFFMVDKKETSFRLRFEHVGYLPAELAADSIRFSVLNFCIPAGDVLMRRKPREHALNEAVVKATQIKFFHKHDTLVYNADAFQLAEGNMLDALIRQLPGAELKDDGRILINGRQVESLLLNGKDFFKGKNEVMLDNLPSYMVHQVQVYEKQDKLSEFMDRNTGNRATVMDVRLKKQYSIGWMAQAEAGGGSHERYLGRLFALRFTPQSRLAFFGNANNLNDNRKPGQDTEWTPDKMPDGLLATRLGGLDYNVDDRLKRFSVNGSATAGYTHADKQTETSGENFLPGGNTFRRARSRENAKSTTFSTEHTLQLNHGNAWQVFLEPRFGYRRWDNRSCGIAAELNANPTHLSAQAVLDSISGPAGGSFLRRYAVNRTLNQDLATGEQTSAKLTATFLRRLIGFGSGTWVTSGFADYTGRHSDAFSHYRLDYPDTDAGTAGTSHYENRWNPTHPSRDLSYAFSTSYWFWFPINLAIVPKYTFHQTLNRSDRLRYRLDRLAGWGENDSGHCLGMLPSEAEHLEQALDTKNSEWYDGTDTYHEAELHVQWNEADANRSWNVSATLPVRFMHYDLRLRRNGYNGRSSRNATWVNPQLQVRRDWHGRRRGIEFKYEMDVTPFSMTDVLDIENDADPLNIYYGNKHLKDSRSHKFTVHYMNNSTRKQRNFSASAVGHFMQDAVAWSYIYESATGIRRHAPANVNGNYVVYGSINYAMPLDRARKLTLRSNTFGQYIHSVDLTGTDSEPLRSTVHTTWCTEDLQLDCRIRKTQVGVRGKLSWNRSDSRREGFTGTEVLDYSCGLTAQAELSRNWQIATDLTCYSRRGYSNRSADGDDLVWNARLAKRLPEWNLTLVVDGFDILGQLSNLTQSMDAQGRLETYRNILPSYFVVHAIWRLSRAPKKQ